MLGVHADKCRFVSSKAIATYPSELCRVLAGLHINAYAERIRFASDFSGPLDVPGYVGERERHFAERVSQAAPCGAAARCLAGGRSWVLFSSRC